MLYVSYLFYNTFTFMGKGYNTIASFLCSCCCDNEQKYDIISGSDCTSPSSEPYEDLLLSEEEDALIMTQ